MNAERSRPPLREQVVVITGASQGIGRETALLLARRGASVVAAARNEEALGTLAAEIGRFRGRIETVVADVGRYADVERIADRAIERFGRIDTWVNNAGVSIYARVEELEPEELDRVICVNLLGQMYGSRVAVAAMRSRGTGTLINIGSALGERAVPLQSVYVASKHGVAGFTEALRVEMEASSPGIRVVLILPSSINTPLFTNARSKIGTLPMPVPPVYEPQVVAEAIAHAAENGGRDIVVGGAGKLLIAAQRVSSALLDRYMSEDRRLEKMQATRCPDDRRDNLFEPSAGPGSTRGEFGEGAKAVSLFTRELELHPVRKRFVMAGAVLAGLLALRKV